ncbi:MAG: UMP kinase [Theionarchaea archaeon]|nr:UMP kinase [Theionarchaea archaeon]MBU7037443.1 UMP kinase [Theionarchaea archaeon]
MKVVLRIGGSVLVPSEIDKEVLATLVAQVEKIRATHALFLVVGGGRTARRYISAARDHNATEETLDTLGILSSQLNALLLVTCIAGAELVRDIHEAIHARGLPILGGTTPGQTTDTVAALLAEVVNADILVKVTNVGGIFTADPARDPAARKISKMSFNQLKSFSKKEFEAGISSVIDPVAATVISHNGLQTVVIGVEDMKDLEKVLAGNHSGTVIR